MRWDTAQVLFEGFYVIPNLNFALSCVIYNFFSVLELCLSPMMLVVSFKVFEGNLICMGIG